MLNNKQYKVIAINERVVLISKGGAELITVPLADVNGASPMNLCKTSFALGWAAAKAGKPD